MSKLPVVICSSVIRSSQQGESHGGLYLVDLESAKYRQIVDWDDPSINWEGRGADRGLRGIAFYRDEIICAASDEVFFYDKKFNITRSYKNKYLKHCHEIFVEENFLYLSSTGFDSILKFDLNKNEFVYGYCYRFLKPFGGKSKSKLKRGINKIFSRTKYYSFDPLRDDGPFQADTTHINNVFVLDGVIFFSGTKLNALISVNKDESVEERARIPLGTHNVQFYRGGVVFNNTKDDNITLKESSSNTVIKFEIVKYSVEGLSNADLSNDLARQGFGRGQCTYDGLLIGGSSPSTISVYNIADGKMIKSINLSKDLRNSVHGLEVFPYAFE